jgi:arylsulfatase B
MHHPLIALASVFVLMAVRVNAKTGQTQSNIVFILFDDLGTFDFITPLDRPSDINTPVIDHLASKGVRLTNYYTDSVCTPARAALMTGRYSVNTGLTHVLVPGSPAGLPLDIPTLPELLKNLSYSTAMRGKWHLGHAKPNQTPVGRGFDSFTGKCEGVVWIAVGPGGFKAATILFDT